MIGKFFRSQFLAVKSDREISRSLFTDKKSSGNDPIHDQDTYITGELREKLEEKGIYAQAIIQCKGDCVFIPQVDI